MSSLPRFFHGVVIACISLGVSTAVAQSGSAPGDLYFDGFQSWKTGEKLEQEGNKQAALQKYLDAYKAIESVAQTYPEWQPDVVSYRLKNVQQALSRLGYSQPPSAAAAAPAAAAIPPGQLVPPPPAAPALPGVSSPLDVITYQLKTLQQQNAAKDTQLNDMAAKMKGYEAYYLEAVKAQQKAEGERDALLQKMRDLNTQLATLTKDSVTKDAATQAEIQKLRNESKMVSDMLASRAREFDDSGKVIESLKKEKEALLANQKRLEGELAKAKSAPGTLVPADMGKLLAENTRLKDELDAARKQVDILKAEGGKKDVEIAELKKQISGIQTEITKLRQENTNYQTQVAELTVKLKDMNNEIQSPAAKKTDSRLVKENETLRNIIMRHLRQQQRLLASKELVIAEMKQLEISSKSLMENLEDMTSGKVRITVDEESLFTEPELKIIIASKGGSNATLEAEATSPKSKKAPLKAPGATPPSSKTAAPVAARSSITPEEKLMVQADQALQSQDYKAAEQALQDVLRANPKNIAALIGLAGIKRSEQKQPEAEVLLQKCLAYEPQNSSALYWLGVCQFQQNRLPDSLASFEKCAQNDKKNARAHHYLGIIYNTMSNRRRAEAEFKSALAIDPEYGDAYFNLAVLYATSSPPDLDKARENYQNALRRGIQNDKALEKLLDPKAQEKTAAR